MAILLFCLPAGFYDHHSQHALQEVGSGAAEARGDAGREPEIKAHGQHRYVEHEGMLW